ncbi:hypothetical protein, partial [Psychrobacter sp. M9-54-1]|uniref:hypothetical protein n=1 Tax=Psychrobacter sp. M9-54-1 TaxID=2782386 RepID=UPI001A90EE27
VRVGHRQLSIPITPLRECVRGFSLFGFFKKPLIAYSNQCLLYLSNAYFTYLTLYQTQNI